jgi:uncharacterized membrane protein HdeD (DUF308 family)
MLDSLARYWWAITLRGVIAVLFGLMALIWPHLTIAVLVALFGAYALVDGAFTLASALFGDRRTSDRRTWLMVEGIAGILVGVVAFAWPGVTTLVVLWLIAAWALVTGVLEIAAAITLRREMRGEWMLAVSGVLSVLFGAVLIVWPATGALAVTFLIGWYAIVFGVVVAALGLRMRRYRDAPSGFGTHRPAPA